MATNMKSVHNKQCVFFQSACFALPFPSLQRAMDGAACAVYVGPWGGHEGRFWEVHGDIQQITVQHGDVVDSLTITYIKGGIEKESIRFGGDGVKTNVISLQNDEQLVEIRGSTGESGEVISSLTFITDKERIFGPYGTVSRAEFSLPVKGGKIAGLFGFAKMHLNAIGICLVPSKEVCPVDVGPWGGHEGDFWELQGDIRQITVQHGEVVDSLTITYLKGGVKKESFKLGGEGVKTNEMILEDDEHLVTIKGSTGPSSEVVSSLTFITDKKNEFGPYGKVSGTKFSLPVKAGMCAGLFGFVGEHLNAIGLGLVPPNQGTVVELGPWGGVRGTPWIFDEEIRSFQVASDGEVIVSITFNDSNKFGGSGGKTSETVHLKSGEYLLSINGATGKHGEVNSILQTISFVTNEQPHGYGPYGKAGEGAVPFGPPVKNGKIVGFSGRQGTWIDAIAFKVAPVP